MADYNVLPLPRSIADGLRFEQVFEPLSASDLYTVTRFMERVYAAGYNDGHLAGFQEGIEHHKRENAEAKAQAEETDRG